jgi:hypothetical protein
MSHFGDTVRNHQGYRPNPYFYCLNSITNFNDLGPNLIAHARRAERIMSITDTSMKRVLVAAPQRRNGGFLRALVDFFHDFQRTVFDTYHPERHYMRGPGPACAAKRADSR